MDILTQNTHIIPVKAAVADAFAGTLNTDIINMKNAKRCTFLMHWGVGATGTTVVTVDACDDVIASNTTAIAFNYKRLNAAADPATEDTWGALTAATASGFTTIAGSYQMYAIEIDAAVVAATGYGFVRLTCTESVDNPLLGGVIAILSGLRFKGEALPEAIS
jgi:hypothetical protein